MRKPEGTGYRYLILGLFLVVSLICATGALAQDKLLITTNNNSSGQPSNKVADLASVDCWAYTLDGTACVGGQYFHSDTVTPTTNWTPVATSSNYGAWTNNPNNGSVNGCLSCHHSTLNAFEGSGASRGGAYLIGGHKNILRKVVPGQTLLNSEGLPVSNVVDHNGGVWSMNWTTGTASGPLGTNKTAYYLAGWIPEPDLFGDFGQTVSGMPYGSCGRCHTTGYRFDDNGPEPTQYDPNASTYTKLTTAQFPRVPAGGKTATTDPTGLNGPAGSWYLTGIQCERCHKADMQYDASNPSNPASSFRYNAGSTSSPNFQASNGRMSHVLHMEVPANIDPATGKIPGTDFFMTNTTPGADSRPLPNAPYALLCVECHQAYATWTAKTVGTVGETHMTPLPGFEELVPTMDTTKFTTTKPATGQFSATFACTVNGVNKTSTYTTYDTCVGAGGTVAYTPGGMSHGAVTTILNSPHARVTGYVDAKAPATADSTLTINGGTLGNGTNVAGKFNTHFYSEGGVQGSCMGCHNVHGYLEGYVETNATNVKETLVGCATCHMNGSRYSVSMPNHSGGNGTPFPDGADQSKSCVICHMMGAGAKGAVAYHFLRINPNVNYTTFPDAKTYYDTVGSGKFGKLNTYNSGETYTDANGVSRAYPAVALDVDMACGQCHTGGNGKANPYGLTPTSAPAFTRAALSTYATGIHNTVPKTAQSPTFSMAGSTYTAPISVVISEVTPNAQICYTTDGTTPVWQDTTPTEENATMSCKVGTQIQSGGSVTIDKTTTLKAVGGGTNSIGNVLTPSAVVSRTYTINIVPKAPTFSPVSGSTLTKPASTVTITAQDGMTIYYTLNGAIPTSTVSATNFQCTSNPCTTSPLNVSGYVRAIAVFTGGQKSAVATAAYAVK